MRQRVVQEPQKRGQVAAGWPGAEGGQGMEGWWKGGHGVWRGFGASPG